MNPLDLAVGAGVVAMLALPYVRPVVMSLWPGKKPMPSAWRQRWAATLIDFIDEIEDGKDELPRPDHATMLARELVWEIVGGDGPQPSKGK